MDRTSGNSAEANGDRLAAAPGSYNRAGPSWRRLFAAAQIVALLVCLALLWKYPPGPGGILPPCPTHKFAHVYCPGCGALRATHHALHGRIAESLRFNPLLLLVGLPSLAWWVVDLASIAARGRRSRPIHWPRGLGWAALVGLIAFGIVRNLPGEAFEWLRPPETPVPLPR